VRSNTGCRTTFRALKVTSQVATPGAESAVYDCLVVSAFPDFFMAASALNFLAMICDLTVLRHCTDDISCYYSRRRPSGVSQPNQTETSLDEGHLRKPSCRNNDLVLDINDAQYMATV